jgi:hypothetical protein
MTAQKIWCESCQDWVLDFRIEYRNNISWALCSACGEGLVMFVPDEPDRETRKTLAKLIWDAPV